MNLRRKRLRLMRDTQWRGYARTAEGNPIILSQVRSVAALSVLGNSVQDSTPSPDNPVDVVETGGRTGNLFDAVSVANNSDDTNLKVEEYQGKQCLTWVDSGGANKQRNMQGEFKEKTQYTFCFNIYSDKTVTILIYYTDGSFTNFSIPCNGAWVTAIRQSTISKTIDYWRGNFNYATKVAIDIGSSMIIEDVYTTETLPNYEPYGYKVAVTANGRNLFNKGKAWAEYETAEGDISYTTKILKLKPNTVYYCKSFAPVNINAYAFLSSNKKVNATLANTISLSLTNGSRDFEKQITTGDNGNMYIGVANAIYVDSILNDSKLYIIEGSYTADTLPPYEPYKESQSFNVYTPEQLHGVGDAHDTVVLDFDRGKAQLIQEVSFGEFNGEENWYTNTEATNIQKYFLSTNIVKPGNTYNRPILSNIAVYSPLLNQKNQVNAYGFQNGNGWIGYCVDANVYPTVDDFKLYLQEMSSNDTPVRVYVDCKSTPTTTDITALQDWDALPQLRGTWILTATGGTEPTLKAEYYSEERSTE